MLRSVMNLNKITFLKTRVFCVCRTSPQLLLRWFIVETNYDPWKAPPASDDRRDAAVKSMNEVGPKNMTAEKLYEVGSQANCVSDGYVWLAQCFLMFFSVHVFGEMLTFKPVFFR